MWNKIQKLLSLDNLSELDEEVINSFKKEATTLESFSEMKATGGWKVIDAKIREELRARIMEAVKDDPKILTLLNILETVETKNSMKLLEEEIEKVLPQ